MRFIIVCGRGLMYNHLGRNEIGSRVSRRNALRG